MRPAYIVVCAALALAGCSNENLRPQISKATIEVDQRTGAILYGGYNFQLVRVEIDGVSYIVNTAGGLVRETPAQECAP